VFGGFDGGWRNDVWALSMGPLPSWTLIETSGFRPSARQDHTAIYDDVGERMIVFAGTGSGGPVNDLWALSLNGTPSWQRIDTIGDRPGVRADHSAVWDPVRRCMLVFGGYDTPFHAFNDAWMLVSGASTLLQRATTLGSCSSNRRPGG
jgi:hypothetical protein